jgi:hypothetical protein
MFVQHCVNATEVVHIDSPYLVLDSLQVATIVLFSKSIHLL